MLLSRAADELTAERESAAQALEVVAERAHAPDPLQDELVADLEARALEASDAACSAQKRVQALERKAGQRENMLERERERHAATRAKLAERKAIASKHWQEILRLRAQLKRMR